MRIEGQVPSIQIKQRLYLPGIICYSTCKCGREASVNLAKVHTSFLQTNTEHRLYFECTCGQSWTDTMIVSLAIRSA